jgi:hypothetical protein
MKYTAKVCIERKWVELTASCHVANQRSTVFQLRSLHRAQFTIPYKART